MSGNPTANIEYVNEPITAQLTFERIPPERGIPPKIRAIITFISKPVPVESDAEPV